MTNETKKPFGRPTKYGDHILKESMEYLDMPLYETVSKETVVKDQIQVINIERPNSIPSQVGLALHLDVHRETIRDWAKKHKDFSCILEKLKQKQESFLLHHGLTKGYDSGFAKFITQNLTKYRDKLETKTEIEISKIEIDVDDSAL